MKRQWRCIRPLDGIPVGIIFTEEGHLFSELGVYIVFGEYAGESETGKVFHGQVVFSVDMITNNPNYFEPIS